MYGNGADLADDLPEEVTVRHSVHNRHPINGKCLLELSLSLRGFATSKGYGRLEVDALWITALHELETRSSNQRQREGRKVRDWEALDQVRLSSAQRDFADLLDAS